MKSKLSIVGKTILQIILWHLILSSLITVLCLGLGHWSGQIRFIPGFSWGLLVAGCLTLVFTSVLSVFTGQHWFTYPQAELIISLLFFLGVLWIIIKNVKDFKKQEAAQL